MRKKPLLTILLFLLSLVSAVMMFEYFARARFKDTAHIPGKEIRKVQAHLKLHHKIGYLWKGNITAQDNVLLRWQDQKVVPLITDSSGYRNAPYAIEWLEKSKRIAIAGVGDSFFHDAAYVFSDFFAKNKIFYYNFSRKLILNFHIYVRD